MAEFKITKIGYNPVTTVSDDFIENYMVAANGDYVKIYLYLLYCVKSDKMLSVSSLADLFQCTENDIKRALKYWESKSLLSIEEFFEEEIAPVVPVSVPEKQSYSAGEMKQLKNQEEIRLLLVACEAYLQKQLTRTDIETLLYFYEQLHFSTDLIEYLVQYSVSKNKKSFRYMEAVAIEWHKKGIKTIEEAKLDSKPYAQECYQVLKALGINNHDPLPLEVDFVDRWMKEYGFTIDIILEACNRTIMQIHKPSFEYADGILRSWKNAGVHHLTDVDKLTAEHKNRAGSKPAPKADKPFTTRFHNFEQRSYDPKELEKLFLNQ
jgi:DnaD/phage-associated family protein